MVSSLFSAVILSILLFYIHKKKRLPVLETLIVWQVAFFCYASFITTLSLNLKWITNPPDYSKIVVYVLYTYILVPLGVVWAIELAFERHWLIKVCSFVLFASVLTGAQYVLVWFDFMRYSPPWNFAYMAACLLLIIVLVAVFRKVIHGVIRSEVREMRR